MGAVSNAPRKRASASRTADSAACRLVRSTITTQRAPSAYPSTGRIDTATGKGSPSASTKVVSKASEPSSLPRSSRIRARWKGWTNVGRSVPITACRGNPSMVAKRALA